MAKYTITDKRIIKFYDSHPDIDFQETNLMLVNLLEQASKSSDNNFISNSLSQIMSDFKKQKSDYEQQREILSHNKLSFDKFNETLSDLKSNLLNITQVQNNLQSDLVNSIREIIKNKDTSDEKFIFEAIKQELISFNNGNEKNILGNIQSKFESFQKNFDITLIANNEKIKSISSEHDDATISKFIKDFKSSTIENQEHTLKIFVDDKFKSHKSFIDETLQSLTKLGQETKITQEDMRSSLNDYLKKYENSSKKGEMSENRLETILNDMFKSAEVERTADEAGKGDFFLKRNNMSTILIENKNYSHNVQKKEIDKFKRDVERHQIPGIMFSQQSGIANKENFEFEIYLGKFVLLYLHNVNYDYNIIKQAIDLVDHFNKILIQIDEINSNNDTKITIPNDVLNSVNIEYKEFIKNIDGIHKLIKSFQKQAEDELHKIKLPSLDKFLLSMFPTSTEVKLSPHVCPYCCVYTNTSKKGLASHKNACKRKMEKFAQDMANENSKSTPKQNIVINTKNTQYTDDDDEDEDEDDYTDGSSD